MERRAPARRRAITAEDLLRPEVLLGIAGILTLIGAFGTWATAGGVSRSGWDWTMGKVTFFASLIMLYSAAVGLRFIRVAREIVPTTSVSAVCGFLTLVAAVAAWDAFPAGISAGWGLYLTIIASLIALFAAFQALRGPRGARPRGVTSRGGGL